MYNDVKQLVDSKSDGLFKSLMIDQVCKYNNLEDTLTKNWKSQCEEPIRKTTRNSDELITMAKKQRGGYYDKYMKYKQKYLNAKK